MQQNTPAPNIVFAGHICIDHNAVDGKPQTGWGSPALYMADYLQSVHGLSSTIIAPYGKDFAPFAAGFSLYPKTPTSEHTLLYQNIVQHGQRTQYCQHAEEATLPKLDDDARAHLKAADILFVVPLTPNVGNDTYFSELMHSARPDCLKVLLPQGFLRHIAADGLVSPREFKEAARVLPYFDLVVISDEDHPDAIATARSWKAINPKTEYIVTQNAGGASIVGADDLVHIPTTPIANEDIVSPVGCGDVFSVATAYSLYQSHDLPAAVRAGHHATHQKLLGLNA